MTEREPGGRARGYVFALVRAVTEASAFVGLVLYVPARLLSWSGAVRPAAIGALQVAGIALGLAGGGLALWCVSMFVVVGRGTPAPFAPPRRLVTHGPYRLVRNPIYIAIGLTLAGVAVFYMSPALLGYAGLFWLASHLFVVTYEEPALRRTFGHEYNAYCRRVRRWWPRMTQVTSGSATPSGANRP